MLFVHKYNYTTINSSNE